MCRKTLAACWKYCYMMSTLGPVISIRPLLSHIPLPHTSQLTGCFLHCSPTCVALVVKRASFTYQALWVIHTYRYLVFWAICRGHLHCATVLCPTFSNKQEFNYYKISYLTLNNYNGSNWISDFSWTCFYTAVIVYESRLCFSLFLYILILNGLRHNVSLVWLW